MVAVTSAEPLLFAVNVTEFPLSPDSATTPALELLHFTCLISALSPVMLSATARESDAELPPL